MTGPGAMADLSWLLDNFADQLRGIAHVVVVSADGLLLATSRDLPPDRAEQGAGYLIMMSIGDGSALVVLASRHCDVGHVGYEMALLVERVGKALNPMPRDYAY